MKKIIFAVIMICMISMVSCQHRASESNNTASDTDSVDSMIVDSGSCVK